MVSEAGKGVDSRQDSRRVSRQMQKAEGYVASLALGWERETTVGGRVCRRHAAGTRKAQQSQGKGGADRVRQAAGK